MSGTWRHIAIVRPCCIGDAVFALPAIAALRVAAPQPTLEVWTGHHSAPIHHLHGVADRISLMPDVAGVAGAAGLARRLAASDADLVVLLDRSRKLRTALRMALGRRRLVSMAPDAAPQGHEIDRFLDVLVPLGIANADPTPSLPIPHGVSWASDPSVIIHIGGGGNPGAQMGSKQWPATSIAGAMELLHGHGITTMLLGGPDDVGRVREVTALSAVSPSSVHVGDDSLEASARRITAARGYIGPDTGLTHVAAAFGVPTVATFGPTNPMRYAPRGTAVRVAAPADAWQVQHGDLRRIDATHAASMIGGTANVQPADVVSLLLDMLDGGGS